ncbi:MAG: rhodanese-like domain-containing protein [Pseudomonadota bacterium]
MSVKSIFRIAAVSIFLLAPLSHSMAVEISSALDPAKVSKSRQTPFGLYVTPTEAHRALAAHPQIVLIDVRDPIEISFVGHPKPMDGNIPLRTVSREFNPGSGTYKMVSNAGFVADVDALMQRLGFSKDHPVIVSCRSGPRSAAAARMLHAAGYKQVWNQVEGFEGSIDAETGARSRNGWRNAGLPWSYRIAPGAAWQPTGN